MKLFISSSLSKLSIWMTIGALGVNLLGLPMTAVAQEDSGIESVASSGYGRHSKLYVNNTAWLVEYAENGRNGDYSPIPWVFSPDGTVHSGNLWQGIWQIKSRDTISVVIRMNGDSAWDQFNVKFVNGSKFIAYKNGSPYRYGVRQ